MTDVTGEFDGPGGHLDLPLPERRSDFRAADRHSARVRFLRRAIVVGTVIGTSLLAATALFDPFRNLPQSVSVGRVGLNGTKVTMDSPKMSGLRKDGGVYEVRARSGIQDITSPNIIELLDVDAKVGMADNSTALVTATSGVYDGIHDSMLMKGVVRIKNDSGYDIHMTSARMDFKTGGLVTDERVEVFLNGGKVAADRMDISDNGHKITFEGGVKSVIEPNQGDAPQPPDARAEPKR